jgi:hypothetical protein
VSGFTTTPSFSLPMVEIVVNQFDLPDWRLNDFVAAKGRLLERRLLRHNEFGFHNHTPVSTNIS